MEEKGKKLKLWNIVGLGLGSAIGTGIFVMMGYGIAYTGRSVMLVCMVGCLVMLLAYWYCVALSSVFVVKGGTYGMRMMMCTPTMTGVFSFMDLIQCFAFSGYVIALTDYLVILFPGLANFKTIISMLLLIMFFALTVRGSRFIAVLQNVITVALVAALIMFVAFGLPKVEVGSFFSNSNPDGPFFKNGIVGFISAVAVMGWACQGTTGPTTSMTAVTENPKRNIPLGILIITCLLAVVYGLMGFVAGGVLPYDQIADQNISVTAQVIMPQGFYLFFVVGGGICAIASSILSSLGMVRYPFKQMTADGWYPAIFKKEDQNGYPYVTYLLVFLMAAFPIVTGMSLDAVVSLVMIPQMLVSVYLDVACITIPQKYPQQWAKRFLKIPVWLWRICCVLGGVCALFVCATLFTSLSVSDAILCVVLVVVMIGIALLRIKQGAVKAESLQANREMIIQQAICDNVATADQ